MWELRRSIISPSLPADVAPTWHIPWLVIIIGKFYEMDWPARYWNICMVGQLWMEGLAGRVGKEYQIQTSGHTRCSRLMVIDLVHRCCFQSLWPGDPWRSCSWMRHGMLFSNSHTQNSEMCVLKENDEGELERKSVGIEFDRTWCRNGCRIDNG